MIVVLDTNVFVAAMVAKGLCYEVVVRALGSCTVVTSHLLTEELERTVRARFSLGPGGRTFLEQLASRTRLVQPAPLPAPVCRDADDDQVLATAIAGGATVIVTGDQDLLVIRRYKDIDIVSPRDFLGRLSSATE